MAESARARAGGCLARNELGNGLGLTRTSASVSHEEIRTRLRAMQRDDPTGGAPAPKPGTAMRRIRTKPCCGVDARTRAA